MRIPRPSLSRTLTPGTQHGTPRHHHLRDVGLRRWRQAGPRRAASSTRLFEPVPRNRLRPGLVIWARVPFEERDEYKIRPAIACEVRGRAVTVLPCTSSGSRALRGAIEVEDLRRAGLSKATGVRTGAVTIDIMDVIGVAGQWRADATAEILGRGAEGRRPPVAAGR